MSSREFGEPNYIQCLCFDPKGEFIGKSPLDTEPPSC